MEMRAEASFWERRWAWKMDIRTSMSLHACIVCTPLKYICIHRYHVNISRRSRDGLIYIYHLRAFSSNLKQPCLPHDSPVS